MQIDYIVNAVKPKMFKINFITFLHFWLAQIATDSSVLSNLTISRKSREACQTLQND